MLSKFRPLLAKKNLECLRHVTRNYAGKFGSSQSPIDIIKKDLKTVKLPPLEWGSGYFDASMNMDVKCDGHSIVITVPHSDTFTISGGGLSDVYRFNNLHLHWGSTNGVGGEHTIDGKSYSMEMHAVHTKGKLTIDEAMKIPNGFTVIGYMIDVADVKAIEKNPNLEAFKILTKTMDSIQKVKVNVPIVEKFPLKNLMTPFCTDYITYPGSLTTKPYSEAVVWILARYKLVITEHEMKAFRSLFDRKLMGEKDNFRQTQPLNGRIINYNTGDSSAKLETLKKQYHHDKYAQDTRNMFKK